MSELHTLDDARVICRENGIADDAITTRLLTDIANAMGPMVAVQMATCIAWHVRHATTDWWCVRNVASGRLLSHDNDPDGRLGALAFRERSHAARFAQILVEQDVKILARVQVNLHEDLPDYQGYRVERLPARVEPIPAPHTAEVVYVDHTPDQEAA